MRENRGWMSLPRRLPEFENGLVNFLNASFAKVSRGNQIRCPCKKCINRYWCHRSEVYDHLKVDGFVDNYDVWTFHGENHESMEHVDVMEEDNLVMEDNLNELVHDRFRETIEGLRNSEGPNEEAKKFYRLVEEGKQELFPGCKTFSKLSFIIRLLLLKTLHGLSNVAFNDLLKLWKEVIPDANLPSNFYEAKKILRDLGLDYQKIYACPNDCMLYWKEYEDAEECHVCHTSKWKQREEIKGTDATMHSKKSRVPAKVLWHFPLKPRLQRLFMCYETAKSMTWHADGREEDGNLRHPADGSTWKDFDSLYPNFSKESRNVRLGLASDGFNPFRTMSIAHSTWPVVLINYNLPPSMFMKQEYLMLSLLIPGPESPCNNIDVYMQPLKEELLDLWNHGIETYDKYKDQTFQLHVALMWTISDFPGYSMLSGCKTKGKFACPDCNYETPHLYLKNSKKMCYMDFRRHLDANHPFRSSKKFFNGKEEHRPPPKPLTGFEVHSELLKFENLFGKTVRRRDDPDYPWKKRPWFFELPYWKDISCRHNLDVMHIEKNICDNLLGTLLDVKGKTKDHEKGRFDLMDLGFMEELHPQLANDGKHVFFKKGSFSMSSKEKDIFCRALREAKLPYGCASNIARCVRSSERKVVGYKSHDAHIILHYLLQVAVRKSLPKHVAIPLIRLGAFFRKLCSKVIDLEDLKSLQTEITETLCELERIFVPSFFDIMTHLPVHLVDQVKCGGPVHGRCMYFMERYLCKLKSYVRNRSHPEGSMAEGYWLDECSNFLARYMHKGKSKGHNEGEERESDVIVFKRVGHPLGGKKRRKGKLFTFDVNVCEQAHRYALFNSDSEDVNEYIREHEVHVSCQPRKSKWAKARDHSHEFTRWFRNKAVVSDVPDHIFWLAKGPTAIAKRYSGYYVNGFRFYTKARDSRCKTQNSGVSLVALTPSFASTKDKNPILGKVTYFGSILEIIELNYWSKFSVVLFRCEWYQEEKDNYGLPCVNVNKFCSLDDPFVLPSQVQQVWYAPDPVTSSLNYVMNAIPRDLFDYGGEGEEVVQSTRCVSEDKGSTSFARVDDAEINLSRDDIEPMVMDANVTLDGVAIDYQNQEDSDFDDTLWDWMEADEDIDNVAE